MNINIKKLKKLIDKYDVISFDIFDTLLLRPYMDPTDLFLHMEFNLNIEDFYHNRIIAEAKAARMFINNDNQDITLDEIYSCMPESQTQYKNIEIQWEIDTLIQNKEIFEIYQYALSQGKKIYIISDMYLSKQTLAEALFKNGYTAYDKLYVSSEDKLTKSRDGDLFQKAFAENDINPKNVLHLGDNMFSDVEMAKKSGADAFFYPQAKVRYLKKNKRVRKLYKNINKYSKNIKLDLSVLMMMDVINDLSTKTKPLWQDMGYRFVGPMVYSFTKWIEIESKKRDIKNIAFIARDGYFLHKVMNIINPHINSNYIYASRKAIQTILEDKNTKEKYVSILENKGVLGKNTAMVDVGSVNFTTQTFFNELNPDIHGFYWCTGNDSKMSYQKFYQNGFAEADKFMGTGLIELFMTSPEAPVKSMDSESLNPIYKEMNNDERFRSFLLGEFNDGVVQYAMNAKKIFGKKSILQTPESIILWNNLWLLDPTYEELKQSKKVKHASNQEHSNYEEILKLKRRKKGIINKIIWRFK